MAPAAGVVIVAAGEGKRLKAGMPKAWVPLAGKPLFLHSLETFHALHWVKRIVLVVSRAHVSRAARLLASYGFSKVVRVVAGGKRRQDSVALGARALPRAGLSVILVHDNARPFVDSEVALGVARAALRHGGALAALPVSDTPKRAGAGGCVAATLSRSGLWLAQTPQAVRADLVPGWLEALAGGHVTDDVQPLEEGGVRVRLVPGSGRTTKVTFREDLSIVRALAGAEVRAGFGFDTHRLVPRRKLILGGVRVPFSRGLDGHSDADLVCHALTDALLGSLAKGDMGTRFGVRRRETRGASSVRLLASVAAEYAALGWRVAGADVTLLAQAPRLGRYRGKIRASLARALGIGPDQVSLKATTGKGMGSVGRGESMASFALVVLRRPAEVQVPRNRKRLAFL